jgi:polyribonucleotide nucleotidyltransferase
VPISAPVAGIAMGLIKEGEDFIVLTDILGDEDALGDMDFKIAGTADGLTAVQMDIKVAGISTEIMARALEQAKKARLHILGEMAKVLPASRPELSRYAPQHCEVEVNPDVLRLIIGPGGKNIKAITAETGASIDIDDSGKVAIFAPTQDAMERAKMLVLAFDQRAELGKNYEGAKVIKILEIGCIVELASNLEALVHVSQLDVNRVEKVTDFVKLGDRMTVKVIEVNGDRVRASRKVVLQEAEGMPWNPEETARPSRPPRDRGDRHDRGGDRGDRSGGRR